MSIRIMTLVWDNGPDDKNELLVLLSLADNANDSGVCWPSIDTIARKCRMSNRGVIDILARLEASGILSVYRSSTDGKKNVNQYTIQIKALIRGSEPASLGVVNPLHQGSEPASLKPSINLNSNRGIYDIYENEIGTLSPMVADKLKLAIDTYSETWITQAIHIAVERNKRNWSYVEGILKTWRTHGFGNYKPKTDKPYVLEEHAAEVY